MKHNYRTYTLTVRQRWAGLLAVPIGIGAFIFVVAVLAKALPDLLDLRVWIGGLAGIIAGGRWLHFVDRP